MRPSVSMLCAVMKSVVETFAPDVGNLAPNTSASDLSILFAAYGQVLEIRMQVRGSGHECCCRADQPIQSDLSLIHI